MIWEWLRRLKRLLWGCDHDWVYLYDTPEEQARHEADTNAWYEDYPLTAFPMTYRCRICGRVR